jgi:hypothetical protein
MAFNVREIFKALAESRADYVIWYSSSKRPGGRRT